MRLGVLLLVAAHLPLLCAERSHAKEPPSGSGRGKVKPTPCVKDCGMNPGFRKTSTPANKHTTPKRVMPWTEGRTRKKSTLGTERKTTKMRSPWAERSTPKKFMPGTKHTTPKKSKPGIVGRSTKKNTPPTKCELFYFVPTANHTDNAFFFWNNTKLEQLKAYTKIRPFLKTNLHENATIFFPAHLPLLEERNGSEVLVLKDVYVRAKGKCDYGEWVGHLTGYFDADPEWFKDEDQRLQEELGMLEDYVQRIPRSHFGYKVPKAGEDVCLDETGLVVRDFPGIRTCFSMWIFDDADPKPKHFAGRQIYNRINQTLHVNASKIGFDRKGATSVVKPIGAEEFSLPALFLKEMCHVTNESRENRCTYWATNRFYVSLCCCYTDRTECAYKTYKFPTQEKSSDPVIRACATGGYFVMKDFGGKSEPTNANHLTSSNSSSSSVKQFVQEFTSSEFCQYEYTWNPSNSTKLEDVLQVELGAANPVTERMLTCKSQNESTDGSCCELTTTPCPILEPGQSAGSIVVRCYCWDDDLCNKKHSYLNKTLARKFKEAGPCEAQTAAEHLLLKESGNELKKPNTSETEGYMCPVFYSFAPPGQPNAFLQLLLGNNFIFPGGTDEFLLFQEDGCHLAEVEIFEDGDCTEKLFRKHNGTLERLMILICSVQGNPLGENRTSYPDTELKKTIQANLTAAKERLPTCKTDFKSMDFESVSELVVDSSKLERMYDDRRNGTNDNITTIHCYAEVSLVYQQQYNVTFGAISIDDKSLLDACAVTTENESQPPPSKCVWLNSTADDEHQHFACCCPHRWNKPRDQCREVLLTQLKAIFRESVIADAPEEILSELKDDPLTKCFDADGTDTTDNLNRPCARNDGCYTGVHARDDPATTTHKKFGGCVSEYAPGAKKRNDATSAVTRSVETEARFSRVCRLARNRDQCFAVLGTEDPELPEDVKGPQMVCCCGGQRDTAHKCGGSHKFGKMIGDFDID